MMFNFLSKDYFSSSFFLRLMRVYWYFMRYKLDFYRNRSLLFYKFCSDIFCSIITICILLITSYVCSLHSLILIILKFNSWLESKFSCPNNYKSSSLSINSLTRIALYGVLVVLEWDVLHFRIISELFQINYR